MTITLGRLLALVACVAVALIGAIWLVAFRSTAPPSPRESAPAPTTTSAPLGTATNSAPPPTTTAAAQAPTSNPAPAAASFKAQASAICRTELPAIRDAPDFATALAVSRRMRAELGVLTPPQEDAEFFQQWLLAMKTTEDAMLRGDSATAKAADNTSVQDAYVLGLKDACVLRTS